VKRLSKLINICLDKNIPFVSWRLPGDHNIHTCIQTTGKFLMAEKFEEVANKNGFIYAPFHRQTNFPVVFFEPELVFVNDDFDESLITDFSDRSPLYPEYETSIPLQVSKKEYLAQANSFIQSFNAQFTKAVLSRVELVDKPTQFSAGEFILKLNKAYPHAFCHLIHIPGNGTWAGASPETLLRSNNKIAHTVSLAGTKPNPGKEKIVNWSEKEIEEQEIVTRYISKVLSGFGIRDFKKEITNNKLAGNLVHLATEFSFDSKYLQDHLAQFVSMLHPTPAVCGNPEDKALDMIFQTEKHNREYYAGFCGPVNMQGKTDLFVNLRCMKILPETLAIYLGGGLTAKSNPENEWAETVLKSQTLLSLL
jgi:isochorismate synthase